MTSAEQNAALVRRYLADVVGADDPRARHAFLAENARVQDVVFGRSDAGWPIPGEVLEVDVDDVIATEDGVAVRATVRGRSASEGHPYEVAGAWFCRVEDGRIAALWALPDGLGLARQLGTLPLPPFHRDGHDSETDSET